MSDIDKVIKCLTMCRRCECDNCTLEDKSGYPWDCTARENMIDYAIAKLKELEAVKPRSVSRHGANPQIQHFCGNCNAILFRHKQKYCFNCGRPVRWK